MRTTQADDTVGWTLLSAPTLTPACWGQHTSTYTQCWIDREGLAGRERKTLWLQGQRCATPVTAYRENAMDSDSDSLYSAVSVSIGGVNQILSIMFAEQAVILSICLCMGKIHVPVEAQPNPGYFCCIHIFKKRSQIRLQCGNNALNIQCYLA